MKTQHTAGVLRWASIVAGAFVVIVRVGMKTTGDGLGVQRTGDLRVPLIGLL